MKIDGIDDSKINLFNPEIGLKIWNKMHMTKKEKIYQELIRLLTGQIADLTMMSKIELGDDVIEKIKELNQRLEKL